MILQQSNSKKSFSISSSYLFGYHQSDVIKQIQDAYYDTRDSDRFRPDMFPEGTHTRQRLLDFLSMLSTKTLIYQLAHEIVVMRGWDQNEVIVQSLPTPRIFRPGDHGTSVHCDYWYGHGEEYLTVWVPLTRVNAENTFHVCEEQSNSRLLNVFSSDFDMTLRYDVFEKSFHPVLPPDSSAAYFSSSVLHHSRINSSPSPRVSFDFRIGLITDKSSTKPRENFKTLSASKPITDDTNLTNTKFIKYICGGRTIDTLTQHVLIEGIAKARGLQVVGQEAEAERFGFPVLRQYLTGKLGSMDNGIIISSISILSPTLLRECFQTDKKVYFCVEALNNWTPRPYYL